MQSAQNGGKWLRVGGWEVALVGVALGLVAAVLGLPREFLGFATETDFLSGFRPQAQAILDGQPLILTFHPPLYPIVLAAVQGIVHDWFLSGRIISLVSTVVFTTCSFSLFRDLVGRGHAYAVMAGLLCSSVFLVFSASATSDLFFLSLYAAALLRIYRASQSQSWLRWVIAGVVVGLTVLARSNGIVLVGIAVVPFCVYGIKRESLLAAVAAVAGLILPILLWGIVAKVTGSSFWTSGTYANIALTYFATGYNRVSSEGRLFVESQFSGLVDVLLHDPVRIAKVYARDLWNLPTNLIFSAPIVAYPLSLIGAAGCIALLTKLKSRLFLLLLLLTAAHTLLINLKAYEARYFLYLVPFLAAGVYEFYSLVSSAGAQRLYQVTCAAVFVAIAALSLLNAAGDAYAGLHRADSELREAIPLVSRTPESALIIARKEHVAFYADRRFGRFPDVDDLNSLRQSVAEEHGGTTDVYVYIGSVERRMRGDVAEALASRDYTAVSGARPICGDQGWCLYPLPMAAVAGDEPESD